MTDRSFRTLLYSLALLGLLLDQASKYSVFAWLREVESHTFALFQTEPETRFFQTVPAEDDWNRRMAQRGFFLEVAFEQNNAEAVIPHVNHGALFGFLREHRTAANGLFAVISLLAAVAIGVWACYRSTARDAWLCTALGLILGGTLGNLYDRLMFNGVRDFLHWNYLFDWPVFNIADCCLVVGAALLLVQAFLSPAANNQPKFSQTTSLAVGTGSGSYLA